MLLLFQFECYKYLEIISIGDKILLVLQWFQFEWYKYLKIILRRQNSACVANIWVPSLQTFYLNCVTPVASRAAGGHGGKHRNLPIFASARFSSSPSSIFLPQPNFLFSPSSIFLLDIDLIFIHLSFLRPGPANLEASYPSYLRSSWLYFCPCPFSSFYCAKCHMARSFVTDTNASYCSKLCFSRIGHSPVWWSLLTVMKWSKWLL